MLKRKDKELESAARNLFFVWVIIGLIMYFMFGKEDLALFFIAMEIFAFLTITSLLMKHKYVRENQDKNNSLGHFMIVAGILIILSGFTIKFIFNLSSLSGFILQAVIGAIIVFVGYGSLVRHESKEDLVQEGSF